MTSSDGMGHLQASMRTCNSCAGSRAIVRDVCVYAPERLMGFVLPTGRLLLHTCVCHAEFINRKRAGWLAKSHAHELCRTMTENAVTWFRALTFTAPAPSPRRQPAYDINHVNSFRARAYAYTNTTPAHHQKLQRGALQRACLRCPDEVVSFCRVREKKSYCLCAVHTHDGRARQLTRFWCALQRASGRNGVCTKSTSARVGPDSSTGHVHLLAMRAMECTSHDGAGGTRTNTRRRGFSLTITRAHGAQVESAVRSFTAPVLVLSVSVYILYVFACTTNVLIPFGHAHA